MPGGKALAQPGDIMVLGPRADVESISAPDADVSVLSTDIDYLVGSLYWSYPQVLTDRVEAKAFIAAAFTTKVHHVRMVSDQSSRIAGFINHICSLSSNPASLHVNCQVQSSWYMVLDILFPLIVEGPLERWRHRRSSEHHKVTDTPTRNSEMREEAVRVRCLLEGAIDQDWTLEGLARRVHISTQQLARIFKESFGVTPTEYLISLRVCAMAKLLRETDSTIELVAQSVGWRSRARASAAFTKYFGLSPGAYRARSRRGALAT